MRVYTIAFDNNIVENINLSSRYASRCFLSSWSDWPLNNGLLIRRKIPTDGCHGSSSRWTVTNIYCPTMLCQTPTGQLLSSKSSFPLFMGRSMNNGNEDFTPPHKVSSWAVSGSIGMQIDGSEIPRTELVTQCCCLCRQVGRTWRECDCTEQTAECSCCHLSGWSENDPL